MAEARTTVTVATVFVRCLCCHLVVVVACNCPFPCNCPLCIIAIALATHAIALSLPTILIPIATAFVAIVVARPPPLLPLPLPCCLHPLPCLPPSLPLPLLSSLPATFVASTIALIVAHLPPLSLLPSILSPLPVPSTLLATLVAVTITLFVASAFTHPPPLLPLRCHLGGQGEDHTNPVRNPTLATATGAAIIVAAFAAQATSKEGPIKQQAGFQRLADGMRQCGVAAVGVCGAGVILHPGKQWQGRRRAKGSSCGIGNVATKSIRQQQQHDNNTTTNTTTHKITKSEGE
jgi:hypothetical protein